MDLGKIPSGRWAGDEQGHRRSVETRGSARVRVEPANEGLRNNTRYLIATGFVDSATSLSKRGSPRKGSQYGCNRSCP